MLIENLCLDLTFFCLKYRKLGLDPRLPGQAANEIDLNLSGSFMKLIYVWTSIAIS